LKGAAAVIEDLGSANGVQVNGKRLTGPQELGHGDRIVVGHHEIDVIIEAALAPAAPPRAQARLDHLWDDEEEDFDDGSETVLDVGLSTTGAVAAELIAAGSSAAAETLMRAPLDGLLAKARKAGLGRGACAEAAGLALKLAQATGKVRWLEYVFELHAAAGLPFGQPLVRELRAAARRVGPSALAELSGCLERLRATPAAPAALAAELERLLGLGR
jgi:hypothetical protein